ncbi:13515_t:CDS:2 [Dentiscutata erythropus]|uniref:13515_t:CDS:1 n=1 Tax=Dentiscutata erythropus TaxID=1348616 RepID=A0A9N9HBE9_9GLOM|nr:13515_t:CDS:2 [Dentiscutata erythropus]
MGEEVKKLTPTGRIQRPAYNIVAEWIKRCCGISTSQDGFEEDVMFNYKWVNDPEARNKRSNFVYANVDNFDDNESIVDLTQNDDANMNNDDGGDNLYEGEDSRNRNSSNKAENEDNWNKDKKNSWNNDVENGWNENDENEGRNGDWNEDRSEYPNEDWNEG